MNVGNIPIENCDFKHVHKTVSIFFLFYRWHFSHCQNWTKFVGAAALASQSCQPPHSAVTSSCTAPAHFHTSSWPFPEPCSDRTQTWGLADAREVAHSRDEARFGAWRRETAEGVKSSVEEGCLTTSACWVQHRTTNRNSASDLKRSRFLRNTSLECVCLSKVMSQEHLSTSRVDGQIPNSSNCQKSVIATT